MEREPIDVKRLEDLLDGWTVRWTACTGSTNADLLDASDDPAPQLLVTEEQTAGRGRFDRVWTSPRSAGLTFSLLLRPDAPVASWGWLPLMAGVALADAVRSRTEVQVGLKWPNDLLAADGRKLAGILAQASRDAAVIGTGLNVSTTTDELPLDTATSLAVAGANGVDRTELLAAIALGTCEWADRFDETGGDAAACGLAEAYAQRCVTLGREVRVSLGDGGVLAGTAENVGPDGSLTVVFSSGTHTVSAGDVEHLR